MFQLVNLYEKNPHTKKLNLMFMNIKDVTTLANALAKFRNLEEISFHGNKITSLSSLELIKNLRGLDVSNNPIKIDQFVLDALYQSKQLRHLYIDCNSHEKKTLIQNLPNLLTLNGEKILREQIVKQTFEQELCILQKKLNDQMQRAKQTYDKMIGIYTENFEQDVRKQWQGKNYDEEFSFLLREIKEEMSYFYSGLQDQLSSEGVYAYCKNKLTIVYDNLIIRLLDEHGNEAIVKIYEQFSKIKAENFDLLLKIILNTSYERYIDGEFNAPDNRLRKQTLYQNEIFRLKKQILELKKEKGKSFEFSHKHQVLSDKRKQYKMQKSINKQAGKFSKSITITPRSYQNEDHKSMPYKQKSYNMKKSPSSRNMSKSPSNTNMKRSVSSKNIQKGNNSQLPLKPDFTATPSKNINSSKITNLDHMLKLIEQIMTQKRKENSRNLSKNDVFETAEQFMFIFLSRRYGLKEVALEWSLEMINAIKMYCKQSIEVEIFGKILKNSIYQEYYDQVKRFTKQIQRLLAARAHKNAITQQQFKKIFFYFFSYEQQQSFVNIAKTLSFPMSAPSLHYFLQSFKLAFQQKYLNNFRCLFAKLDSDDDSYLNLKQSKNLVVAIIKSNKQVDQLQQRRIAQLLCSALDKSRKDKFIFSELFQIIHKYL